MTDFAHGQTVRSSLRGIEAEALLRGIRVDTDVDETVVALFAPFELQRVLQNLLTNAIRHTPSDGSVAVRVSARNGEVRVSVEDSGEGLGDEARERKAVPGGGGTFAAKAGNGPQHIDRLLV